MLAMATVAVAANAPDRPAKHLTINDEGLGGLWYDPGLDGDGFNIIRSATGTVILYYGYRDTGERLWLISETLADPIELEHAVVLDMFVGGDDGSFALAAPSSQLAAWGTLSAEFTSCNDSGASAIFVLDGVDGVKTFDAVQLARNKGASCSSNDCGQGAFESTFEAIQTVIFDGKGCNNGVCHGAAPGTGNLNLQRGVAYDNLVAVPATLSTQNRVEPGEPALSYLYEKLSAGTLGTPTSGSAMPNGGAPLSVDQLRAMELWIRGGAPRDLVVAGTETLLDVCLPNPDPLKIPVPATLDKAVQLQQTAWPLRSQSEQEVCLSTYYDFTQTNLIPDDFQVDCPGFGDANNPSGKCFYYHKQTLHQDAQSHHSIIHIYTGDYDVADSSIVSRQFGPFTFKPNDADDPSAGLSCDPKAVDPATGFNPDCSGVVRPSVACIGYGPPDFSTGGLLGSSTAPTFSGSQEPYYQQEFADGVYSLLPMQGVITWNSHAFNTTGTDTTMAQYLNIELASPEDRQFPVKGIFDNDSIFVQNVPPFETREYCRTYTAPLGANIFQLSSHTHRHGVQFRIWEPPNVACVPGQAACVPGPSERLIYLSTDYSDPEQLRFDPPKQLSQANAAERSYLYCSLYDNGSTPSSPSVKRRSTSPWPTSILVPGGPCPSITVACLDGPQQGQLCAGSDGFCDSSTGAGDGICDACPVRGGVTTEDEMYILIGSYY